MQWRLEKGGFGSGASVIHWTNVRVYRARAGKIERRPVGCEVDFLSTFSTYIASVIHRKKLPEGKDALARRMPFMWIVRMPLARAPVVLRAPSSG